MNAKLNSRLPRFGLKALLAAVFTLAIAVRGFQLVSNWVRPKTDITGQLVCEDTPRATGGVTAWAEQSEAGTKFQASTNKSGNFRFRNLDRGHVYRLWIDEDDWVTPAIQVSARERLETATDMRLTKGLTVRFEVVDLTTGEPPTGFSPHVRAFGGSGNPEFSMSKIRDLGNTGAVDLRLAVGTNHVLIDDGIVVYPFAG